MGNKQYERAVNPTDGLPTVFAVFDSVLYRQRERVGENTNGSLETHAMLAQI